MSAYRNPLIKQGDAFISLDPLLAAKAALNNVMLDSGYTRTDLAARLGVAEKIVRRLLDPKHPGYPIGGYYSCPVRRNFLIIYLYCSICRKKGDDAIVLCADCKQCPGDTLKFIALGPHDKACWG